MQIYKEIEYYSLFSIPVTKIAILVMVKLPYMFTHVIEITSNSIIQHVYMSVIIHRSCDNPTLTTGCESYSTYTR